jgi:hypothetical protein
MTPAVAPFVEEPLPAFREYPPPEMIDSAEGFHADLVRRRTVLAEPPARGFLDSLS